MDRTDIELTLFIKEMSQSRIAEGLLELDQLAGNYMYPEAEKEMVAK